MQVRRLLLLVLGLSLWSLPAVVVAGRIHIAAQKPDLDEARKLVEENPSLVNAKDDSGNTPLHYAARSKKTEVCRFLLEHGANVDATNKQGRTPLHETALCYAEYSDAVELLVQHGARMDLRDKRGDTPLHFAAKYGHVTICKFFIERGADPKNDVFKGTLHMAAEHGSTEICGVLIDNGMDVNEKDLTEDTPLHRAAGSGNLEAVRLLLEKGATVDSKDSGGQTPLIAAAWHDYADICKLLVDHGADPNTMDKRGKTALEWARELGNENAAGYLEQFEPAHPELGETPAGRWYELAHQASQEGNGEAYAELFETKIGVIESCLSSCKGMGPPRQRRAVKAGLKEADKEEKSIVEHLVESGTKYGRRLAKAYKNILENGCTVVKSETIDHDFLRFADRVPEHLRNNETLVAYVKRIESRYSKACAYRLRCPPSVPGQGVHILDLLFGIDSDTERPVLLVRQVVRPEPPRRSNEPKMFFRVFPSP